MAWHSSCRRAVFAARCAAQTIVGARGLGRGRAFVTRASRDATSRTSRTRESPRAMRGTTIASESQTIVVQRTAAKLRHVWRKYSLSLVLGSLFLVSWAAQCGVGWVEFAADERAHGQAPQWFGDGGYVWSWARATFENWQSEFLQLVTFVVLTAYLHHRGSPEAKDSDEMSESYLRSIEKRLERIERELKHAG
jgi:hypothetical protein